MPRHIKATRAPGRSAFADEVLGRQEQLPRAALRPGGECSAFKQAVVPPLIPVHGLEELGKTVSEKTKAARSLSQDLGLRQEQLTRFEAERLLLLKHALQRLHMTQRLKLPRGSQALAAMDTDRLNSIDCQHVLRCLRTGDQLDLRQIVAPAVTATGGTDDQQLSPAIDIDEQQIVLASYEAFLLSYNLLQAEGPGAGDLDVTVLVATGLKELDESMLHGTYVALEVGPMAVCTASRQRQASDGFTTCAWEESFQFIATDGCHSLRVEVYGHTQAGINRRLGCVKVDLKPVFTAGAVEDEYDLFVSNGYKARPQGRIRLRMEFAAFSGLPTEVLDQLQATFEITEMQHEELLRSLALSDVMSPPPVGTKTSVEAMAALQNRMDHRRAVPNGVCMGTCPHYRLLLLQAKRPRDFGSDKAFDEWQERQVAVVANSLLTLVQRLDNAEREAMVGLNESSRVHDVANVLASRFLRVIEISHDYKTSAGFPEKEYTECLDQLYDYAMDIYTKHDRSCNMSPLCVQRDQNEESATRDTGDMDGSLIPASLWEPLRYPLNTTLYETLCASIFDKNQVGRHNALKDVMLAVLERTRAHLGVSNEQAHLCLSRLHFEEHRAAEQETRRDHTRNRTHIEEEREAMLTSLHDHIFLSTHEHTSAYKCIDTGSSRPMFPAVTDNAPMPQHFRVAVTKPMLECFGALLDDHHNMDVELMPRVLQVFTAIKHPETPQHIVRDLLTFAVVRLYERITEDSFRPFGPATLGVVVSKVLATVDIEIEKFERVWQAFVPDPMVIFLRTMGAQVRQDYETCDCPGSIDTEVIHTVMLLQQLENRMLACGALNPASVILAHNDAWHGGASPFSKLAWDWIENHGSQFQRSVSSFIEHESWEAASPTARVSFSIDGLFAMFQEAMETFLNFAIASDEMFICLTEHMVSACINYANGVVGSCGDLLDLVPPSPPVTMCRRLKTGGITRTAEPDASLPSNSSICVRLNNIDSGLQRFVLFYSTAKERWAEFAFIGHSKQLSMRRFDYLVKAVRDTFRDTTNQLVDFLGTKVVFSDLRAFLGDGLYLPTVISCRIDDALAPLAAALRGLDTMLPPPIAREVHGATYRSLVGCFHRVLLDGGEHRIFAPEDKRVFEEDFCAIKALVHRIEELSDVAGITRLMTLLEMSTTNLIDFYGKAETSTLADGTYSADTIKRVIAHRDDKVAKAFMKRALGHRRNSIEMLGIKVNLPAVGSFSSGAEQVPANSGSDSAVRHTQADLDQIFRHAAATNARRNR